MVLDKIDLVINHKYKNVLLGWMRYLDDTWAATNKVKALEEILQDLNGFHKSIQYTREDPDEEGGLPFLDLQLSLTPNRTQEKQFTIGHYIKPTQTNRTINYNSAHPKYVLNAPGFLITPTQKKSGKIRPEG